MAEDNKVVNRRFRKALKEVTSHSKGKASDNAGHSPEGVVSIREEALGVVREDCSVISERVVHLRGEDE